MLRRLTTRRGTLEALANRRNSVLAERRKSMRMGSVDGGQGSLADITRVRERRMDSVVSWRDADA
jgi:hypothetical protein